MEQTLKGRTAVAGMGFLGSALAAALRERGEPPCGIDPAAPATYPCTAAELPQDLPADAFRRIFCCMATHGGDADAYRSCYLDTVHALHRRFPTAKLVFCSSTSVYAVEAGREATEEAPVRHSPRTDVLQQTEREVLCHGGLVARLAPLFGTGRCELLRRHLAQEERLPGPPGRMLNYLHRDDAVAALLLLAERGEAGRIYNVCGESLSHAEAYTLLEGRTGIPASATCSAPGRRGTRDLRVDTARLRSLGWTPARSLADFFETPAP